MKTFFTKKRIAFTVILIASLITLIALLIAPIGSAGNGFWIYYTYENKFLHCSGAPLQDYGLTSPFTLDIEPYISILIEQTIVFTLVGIIFLVFLVLFIIELKKAGAFKRKHPTKAQRIAELEKQVGELKSQQQNNE